MTYMENIVGLCRSAHPESQVFLSCNFFVAFMVTPTQSKSLLLGAFFVAAECQAAQNDILFSPSLEGHAIDMDGAIQLNEGGLG